MAGCRGPALQVCGSLVAGGVRVVAGGASLVAGGASRPPAAYCIRAPGTGFQPDSSAWRRSPLNGSLSGFFLIGYYSIFQLFKFSYRLLHAKVFTGENFIKTLFSINYRGYFIIQAAHSTINYSYFLHKTGKKT